MEIQPPSSKMVRCGTITWPFVFTFWNLLQANCAVLTVSTIGKSMHEVFVADRWDEVWNTFVEIIVGFFRRRYLIELELVDFLILT